MTLFESAKHNFNGVIIWVTSWQNLMQYAVNKGTGLFIRDFVLQYLLNSLTVAEAVSVPSEFSALQVYSPTCIQLTSKRNKLSWFKDCSAFCGNNELPYKRKCYFVVNTCDNAFSRIVSGQLFWWMIKYFLTIFPTKVCRKLCRFFLKKIGHLTKIYIKNTLE